MTRSTRFASIALMAVCLGACGGIGPGDYRVYRVAFEPFTQAPNCAASGVTPVDDQDDTSSQFVSGTYVLYVAADEQFYLDIGTSALRGTETGEEDFQFAGQTTVVAVEGNDPMMPDSTTTRVTDVKVIFNVEGEVVDGNVERTDTCECEGPMCDPNPNPPCRAACTRTAPFVGGEVSDVTLEHEV